MKKDNDRLTAFMKNPGYNISGLTYDDSYPTAIKMILVSTMAALANGNPGESKRFSLEDRILENSEESNLVCEIDFGSGPVITDGRIGQIAKQERYYIKYDLIRFDVKRKDSSNAKFSVIEHHVLQFIPVRYVNGKSIDGPANKAMYDRLDEVFIDAFDMINSELFDKNIQCYITDFYNPMKETSTITKI
ncbi:hypothetical protein J6X90_03950 [Candidatus Saccharibacteria bacterium]|nr:hypothetical protein [Candidatus Saccharibacteria bacterium]